MKTCSSRRHLCCTLLGLVLLGAAVAEAQSLRGSRGSMDRQVRSAVDHDYTFLENPSQVRRFVSRGYLVPVKAGVNYSLAGVSFPYTRPEVKLFIQRLSSQYRRACGEKLVVTSLTRPKSHQPHNASWRSVHPTGMALDLRRSKKRACRRWLERVLLSLEGKRVLEATYERQPPHYHIAVFPKPYARYVARLGRQQYASYRVTHGDTLWEIAKQYRTTVREIRDANSMRSNTIRPGQVLKVPVGS